MPPHTIPPVSSPSRVTNHLTIPPFTKHKTLIPRVRGPPTLLTNPTQNPRPRNPLGFRSRVQQRHSKGLTSTVPAARPAPDVHCRQSLNLNPRCAVGATPHCVPLTSTHHLGHLTSSPRPLRHATTNPTNTPTIQSTPPYPTPRTPIPPADALTGQAPKGCRPGSLTPALPTAPRRTTGPTTLTSHRAHSPTVHNRIMDRSTAPQPTGDRFRLVPPMAALGMGDHPKAAHPTVDRPTADHPTGNRPMVDNHPPNHHRAAPLAALLLGDLPGDPPHHRGAHTIDIRQHPHLRLPPSPRPGTHLTPPAFAYQPSKCSMGKTPDRYVPSFPK